MRAAPIEDLQQLEQEVREFRAAVVDLLEVYLLTDDKASLAAAVRIAHETLKTEKKLDDFDFDWPGAA